MGSILSKNMENLKKELEKFPLQEISSATDRFSKKNIIGEGGYGKVFKGKSKKHGHIAVKRWDPSCHQGDHEFKTEIKMLSEYKHENIVSLLGFCDDGSEKILVYKFEINGSLDKHLIKQDLKWIQRLQICLGAAYGLAYLHDNNAGFESGIYHRDVKSSNILLDDKWKPKISDFGLSRVGSKDSFVISNPCGTPGHVDPDYNNAGYLSKKSDVYSFGIVLWEVVCGMPVHPNFIACVQIHYRKKILDKIIPSYIYKQINPVTLGIFTNIAYQCLKNAEERPTMNHVVEKLQWALQNQQAPSGSRSKAYHDSNEVLDFQFSGGNVTLISDMDAWDQKLSEAKTLGKIVIANFTASWCRKCREVSPHYISLSEKHPSLMFLTINAEKLTKLSIEWNLNVTPTFFFLKDGKQIDKLEGADNRKLLKKIKTALDSQVHRNSFHHDDQLFHHHNDLFQHMDAVNLHHFHNF